MISKAEQIAALQSQILALQGFKPPSGEMPLDMGWGPIDAAFPHARFSLGAVHEFISGSVEDAAATCGFISGILATLIKTRGAVLWISSSRLVFPAALACFNIDPSRILFVDVKKSKDVQWVMEEALKCRSLAAVVGEINEMNFTASRRLQLAVETSRVTGLIHYHHSRPLQTTASVSRWRITHLPSELENEMPGVGFPRWNVELLKIRNGRPGKWHIEWKGGRFQHVAEHIETKLFEQQKKVG